MILDDTIAAIATAPGEAAIGIVRLSGPEALPVLQRIFRPARPGSWRDRRLAYGQVRDPATGAPLDEAMAVYLPPPSTYTREAMAEIYCHGGYLPAAEVLRSVLEAGARMARPGEFTLRAFLNGRVDLAQAEAVIAAVRSRTREGLQAAVAQLAGKLSGRVAAVRQQLLGALAHLEASLDFPDEDVPPAEIEPDLQLAAALLDELLAEADAGVMLREGLRVAIVGRPNVGKSSLLNALLRADRAIVTPVPGTTRDTVEETADLGGVPIRFVDTAGLTEAADPVERLGVARALQAMNGADGLLAVFDASAPLTGDDRAVAERVVQVAGADRDIWAMVLLNKSDLPAALAVDQLTALVGALPLVSTSAAVPGGVSELERRLGQVVKGGSGGSGELPSVTSARHRDALRRAAEQVAAARAARRGGLTPDLVAIDLHAAVRSLGEITGESIDDELLQRIFADFCLGK